MNSALRITQMLYNPVGLGFSSLFVTSDFNLEPVIEDIKALLSKSTKEDIVALALKFASIYSNDPSTQNGAVLVSADRKEMIVACNNFPIKIQETEERWSRENGLKYMFVEHAERNAIYLAASRSSFSCRDAILYCPWFACPDCARAIIQSGIKVVVGHSWYKDQDSAGSWAKGIKVAVDMLNEAGVEMEYVNPSCGINIRFNGEIVTI